MLLGERRLRRTLAAVRLTSEPARIGPAIEALLGQVAVRDPIAATPGLADAIRICLAEVLGNAIEHGYTHRPGAPLRVRLKRLPDGVALEIRDRGRPIPPDLADCRRAMPAAAPADSAALAEGGRGWPIIHSVARHVGISRRSGWNCLLLEIGHGSGC